MLIWTLVLLSISIFAIALMRKRLIQLQRRLEELQNIHAKTNAIMTAVPAGLFQASVDGQCLYVNQTWINFTGLSSEEAMGHGWKKGMLPEELERVEKEWHRLSERKAMIQLAYHYWARGELRWIHTKAVPHLDENGNVLCYYGASVDITAQKKNESDLRESRNLLAAILENLPVALVCKDVQKNFAYTFANRKSQEMHGRSESEMVGQTDQEIYPASTAENLRWEDLTVCKSGQMLECHGRELSLRDGRLMYVSSRKIPLYDESGKVRMILVIVEDRTSQYQYEKLIEDQRLRLIHSEKMSALGEMAGGIAHEINTPLTVIELCAGQLKMKLAQGVREMVELESYTSRISGTVQRIAKIVRGLKTFARDGESDPFEAASIEVLIREAYEFCQGRFQQHNVDFQLDSSIGEQVIQARPVQLSQVFLNLLNNAFDAVRLRPEPWVRVEIRDCGKDIEILFVDCGQGISPDVADKIMRPFFTTKDVGQGTGLGLSVSQSIVKGHQGSLTLKADHAHTCFVVRLPKRHAHSQD